MGSRFSVPVPYQPASLYAAHVTLSNGGKLGVLVRNQQVLPFSLERILNTFRSSQMF